MFVKHYLYRLKSYYRNLPLYFWSMVFPFILATLFYLAFGNYMNDTSEQLNPIPVAVLKENAVSEKESFLTLIDELSSSGDNQVLDIKDASKKEAEKLLEDGTIDAIITVDHAVSLTVVKSGLNQTIIKNILDVYQRKEAAIVSISQTFPENLPIAMKSLSDPQSYLKSISLSDTTPNPMMQYFYALIAMACLYCCFYGINISNDLQGDLSAIAARRSISPSSKILTIFCDFLAALTLSMIGILLLFLYLVYIIKVDFGSHLSLSIVTAFVGCMCSISMGACLGSLCRKSHDIKTSLGAGLSLVLAFLAGLMVNTIPSVIETYCPIINRINPASLLANSFYCLAYYDNFKMFTRNLVTLTVYTVVFGICSALLIRRKKYASI